MLEDVVGDAADEGGDAGQAAGPHHDQIGVELVSAFDDRRSDPAPVRDPECTRFEPGLAREAGAMLREALGLLLSAVVYLGDDRRNRCGAAEPSCA